MYIAQTISSTRGSHWSKLKLAKPSLISEYTNLINRTTLEINSKKKTGPQDWTIAKQSAWTKVQLNARKAWEVVRVMGEV